MRTPTKVDHAAPQLECLQATTSLRRRHAGGACRGATRGNGTSMPGSIQLSHRAFLPALCLGMRR